MSSAIGLCRARHFISMNLELWLTPSRGICHFEYYRKDESMALLSRLLAPILTAFTARPAVPCCATAIHWASFR